MSYLIAQFLQDPHLSVVYKPTGGLPARAALLSTAVPPYAVDADPDSPCRRAAFDVGFALKRAFLAEVNGAVPPALPAHENLMIRRGRIENDGNTAADTKKIAHLRALATKHGLNGAMNFWTVNHVGKHGPVRAATIILPDRGPLNGHGPDMVERALARVTNTDTITPYR